MSKMETILKIEEAKFGDKDIFCEKDGYIITTSSQIIKLGIDNAQSCCESWGYFMSEDDLDDFIGAKLINVTVTDTLLKTKDAFDANDLDHGGVMFVNIETDRGTLQFVAYNEHNGYYGHEACVISTQINKSEYI